MQVDSDELVGLTFRFAPFSSPPTVKGYIHLPRHLLSRYLNPLILPHRNHQYRHHTLTTVGIKQRSLFFPYMELATQITSSQQYLTLDEWIEHNRIAFTRYNSCEVFIVEAQLISKTFERNFMLQGNIRWTVPPGHYQKNQKPVQNRFAINDHIRFLCPLCHPFAGVTLLKRTIKKTRLFSLTDNLKNLCRLFSYSIDFRQNQTINSLPHSQGQGQLGQRLYCTIRLIHFFVNRLFSLRTTIMNTGHRPYQREAATTIRLMPGRRFWPYI